MILAILILLPIKFQDNWSFVSGEEAKNRFLRWRPSWNSHRNNFSYFYLQVTPIFPIKFHVSWTFITGDYSLCYSLGCHLAFLIRTILAIFDLQVTLMRPTKIQVNWSFGSGEKAKNRFSRWQPCRPSWISDQNNFSYF